MITIKQTISWVLLGTAVLATTHANASGQEQSDSQQQPRSSEAEAARLNVQDPIQQLNLTPEQRERIRAIREQLRNERAAVGQRLQETNKALQNALDADNPDEALLENLIKDVAAAQAAAMRLRILNEVRIRRVLTAEQIHTLRRLQLAARETRRLDRVRQRQETFDGRRGLANPRTFRPLYRPIVPQRRPRL